MFSTFYGQQKGASDPKSTDEKHFRHTHLEFHLLGLLGVDSYNMLVVPESVSAVLLLRGHVSLQSLQHTLRLEDKVEEMPGAQIKVVVVVVVTQFINVLSLFLPSAVLHDALT